MQRSVTVCDLCGATDLKPGYVVLTIAGDRAASVKARVPGSRNLLELCDACSESFAAWITSRTEPAPGEVAPAVPAAPPSATPAVPTGTPHEDA